MGLGGGSSLFFNARGIGSVLGFFLCRVARGVPCVPRPREGLGKFLSTVGVTPEHCCGKKGPPRQGGGWGFPSTVLCVRAALPEVPSRLPVAALEKPFTFGNGDGSVGRGTGLGRDVPRNSGRAASKTGSGGEFGWGGTPVRYQHGRPKGNSGGTETSRRAQG